MFFSLFHLRVCILYLVGSSLCTEGIEPWDSVFPDGNPWDIESSEEDSNISKNALDDSIFSRWREDEVLIITHTPPNWSMIPITSKTNEKPTEVPEQIWNEPLNTVGMSNSSPVNQKPNGSTQVVFGDTSIHNRRSYLGKHVYDARFVAIGHPRSRVSDEVRAAFENLKPVIPIPDNINQEQLEMKFLAQKNHYLWREMVDYPLNIYYGYWGLVCDHFWIKLDPADERYRGCFISMLQSDNAITHVHYHHFPDQYTRAQLLRCKCYYYFESVTKPESNEALFAIHKHADNEYFILNNIPDTRSKFTIANFVSKVFLPRPIE